MGRRSSYRSGSYRVERKADGTVTEYHHGRIISTAPFPGARTFVYYRKGQPIYVYANMDIRGLKDKKPRWFLGLFYIPFIAAIGSMVVSAFHAPIEAMQPSGLNTIAVQDKADIFTQEEENALLSSVQKLSVATGVTTQLVTIEWDEWQQTNETFIQYANTEYTAHFSDETGWLIAYSESPDAENKKCKWESVPGFETSHIMDVIGTKFYDDLRFALNNPNATPATSLGQALDNATYTFQNQTMEIDSANLLGAIPFALFIGFHAFIMIFAGSKQKYSYKELEEVESRAPTMSKSPVFANNQSQQTGYSVPRQSDNMYTHSSQPYSSEADNDRKTQFNFGLKNRDEEFSSHKKWDDDYKSPYGTTSDRTPTRCPACGEPYSPTYGNKCPFCHAKIREDKYNLY